MPPCFHGIPTCRALAAAEKVVFLDVGRLKQDLQARVADVKALQGRHTPQARHILRKLLGNEKLRPELIDGDGTKGYRFTGQLTSGDYCVARPRRFSGRRSEKNSPDGGGPDGIRTHV